MRLRWLCATMALACLAGAARADVKLPKLFGDHLVLQQKSDAAIWGWAEPGEEVTITLGDAKATAKAGGDGRWKTAIRTPAAGGPFDITVKGKNTITIKDAYAGEVWICSGQSNMEWPVSASINAKDEAANANYPAIRMINVKHNPAEKPVDDVDGAWTVCTPQTVNPFSAVGYFFARELNKQLNVPVGMIHTSWGGTICEAWTSKEALNANPAFKPILDRSATFQQGNPNQASVLFNGMVNPLLPYAIRGAIWYQGESNAGRAVQYQQLFPAMIKDWRQRFGQGDFPFYFVQLAPFRYGGNNEMLAELWDAQVKTLATTPNTGMAVTTDITDIKDIHPKNKQEVGRRLALWALAKDYGKSPEAYSGPVYDSMTVAGNKIRIKFKYATGGLVAKDGKALNNFTIAGEDRQFYPATAVIDGETIKVSCDPDVVAKPVAVRFGWHDVAEPNLFNKAGLPASPFRTDDFPLTTRDNK